MITTIGKLDQYKKSTTWISVGAITLFVLGVSLMASAHQPPSLTDQCMSEGLFAVFCL